LLEAPSRANNKRAKRCIEEFQSQRRNCEGPLGRRKFIFFSAARHSSAMSLLFKVAGEKTLVIPSSEILWLALAVVAAGLITGVLAGLFGVGGGAVIVPVLYEVFRVLDVPSDLRMQVCIGSSLAIIVPTTVRSYFAHRAMGAVIPQVLRLWSPPAVLGVVVGSLVAAWAPGSLFKLAFVTFAAFVSVKMFVG